MTSILIVAGEHSGERYGAEVVREWKKNHSGTEFFGVGGKRMATEGVELVFSIADLSAVGIVEVLTRILHFRRLFGRLRREIRARRPRAALLIDSPDFNLRLAKMLKKAAIPVLYYISPTVWAWRSGRLKTIQKTVNRMCLIFPFEKKIYDEYGIPAVFVGHPLKEKVRTKQSREAFLAGHSLSAELKLITLLPGSRRTELKNHLPVLLEAARRLKRGLPVQFVLVLADAAERTYLDRFLPAGGPDIRVLTEDGYEAIASSDLVLAACGTANLEAALLGAPLIAFYRLSPLTYYPFRRLLKIREYSIVNILAGRSVVPELIQHDFRADKLADAAAALLAAQDRKAAMREEFRRLAELLGAENAAANVVRELESLASPPPPKV